MAPLAGSRSKEAIMAPQHGPLGRRGFCETWEGFAIRALWGRDEHLLLAAICSSAVGKTILP
jgi:hypothetical protein